MKIMSRIAASVLITTMAIGVVTVDASAFSSSSPSKENITIDNGNTVTPPVNNEGKKNIVINQGDLINTDTAILGKNYNCTLGYIGDGFAITAAHCAEYDGMRIVDKNRQLIGKIVLSDREQNQDTAIIKLEDNVVGSNVYSGDYIVSMAELSPDDEFCQFGQTTKQVLCAKQGGHARYGYMWSKAEAQKGDSGGPVWVKNKGFVGSISSLSYGMTGLSEAWITVNKYPEFQPPRSPFTQNTMSR